MAIIGKDAAYKSPNFLADKDLLPRDDSGGIEEAGRTAEFGDGGHVTGGGVAGSGGIGSKK